MNSEVRNMLNTLIVDDESLARRGLKLRLQNEKDINIIGEAKKFAKGFDLNQDAVNIEEIDKVGHGGNYFTSPETLEYMAELSTSNDIWPSESMDTWIRKGKPEASDILIEKTMELYSKAEIESKENMDIVMKGEEFINRI